MTHSVSEDRAFDPLEGGRHSSVDRIADPGPLGLSAFATTTFMLSCVNAGLAHPSPGSRGREGQRDGAVTAHRVSSEQRSGAGPPRRRHAMERRSSRWAGSHPPTGDRLGSRWPVGGRARRAVWHPDDSGPLSPWKIESFARSHSDPQSSRVSYPDRVGPWLVRISGSSQQSCERMGSLG